jgi:methyl-accepting chemotaxis protein
MNVSSILLRSSLFSLRLVSCIGFVLVFGVLPYIAFSQSTDSLETQIQQRQDDTTKVEMLTTVSNNLARVSPQKSLEYGMKALELAQKLEFRRGEALAVYSIANAQYRLGNYVPALEFAIKAQNLYEKLGEVKKIAQCLNRIGTIYKNQKQYDEAIKALNESLRLFQSIGDSLGMAAPTNNLGETYRSLGNNAAALPYFFQTLVLETTFNETLGIAEDLANIAETYRRLRQFDSSQYYYNQALVRGGDLYSRSEILAGLGRLMYDKNDFAQAYQFGLQALAIDSTSGFKLRQRESLEILAKSAASQQKFREAYSFQQRLNLVSEELFNEENNKKLDATRQASDLKRQEVQAMLRQEEEQKRNTIRNAIAGGAFLLVIIGFLIFLSRKAKARLAEQQGLMRQIEEEKASVERKVEEARAELRHEQEAMHQKDMENLRAVQEQQTYLETSTKLILEAMQKFSLGDLTVAVQSNGKEDDINKIIMGFNRSVVAVRGLVQQVIQNVEETSTIAAHISSASGEMAATSQEQAAQVTQIASSVEDMAQSVSENARHASDVSRISQQNGSNATEGARVVGAAVKKIEEIANVVSGAAEVVEKLGDSSAEIGEIVQVIEEIADQTNLLALNAAIEAARAGDQGRGFAVVADEVRKLAERTAEATKQISKTIKHIQRDTNEAVLGMKRGDNEVREGLTLAKQAGEALTGIMSGSHEVETKVKRSAEATEQQSSTAAQIAKNVEHVSSSVNETTASLNEIARATENLRDLTEILQGLVSGFDVGAGANVHRPQALLFS